MDGSLLVSVIIPTYKRADSLSRAIDSVLGQSYKNLEVIVVDDNNANTKYRTHTQSIMQQYKNDRRVIYIQHKHNQNGAAARNTGIYISKGEFLCFLDDDDWYKPEKIEKQVDYMLNHPEYDAVYCGWTRNNQDIIPTKVGDLTFELLSGINIIFTNTIMVKKSAALQIGGWDERFRRNQEAAFLLRYFYYGYKIGVVSEILVEFDTTDRSNASNPKKNEEDFNFFLEIHKDNISRVEKIHKNAKQIIYSYRYRGVLLKYLKDKDYKGAIKLYFKMIKIMPLRFNKDLIEYISKRIKTSSYSIS